MKRTILKVVATAALISHCVVNAVQADSSHQANVQPRIIGGIDSSISTFPSTVAILLNERLFSQNPLFEAQSCGGTLISSTWVLTAAHCLVEKGVVYDASDISILAGTTDLKAPITTRTAVSEVIVHPDYRQVVYGDDIALLKLAEAAPAPAIAMNDSKLPANENTFIVGWGTRANIKEDGSGDFPSILQSAMVPTHAGADCAALPGNYQFVNASTQICAGYATGGIDSCNGDSGGPLYNVTKDGNLRLAGITSWGDGCAFANRPGIYTDVNAYKGWIDEMISSKAPTRTQNLDEPLNDTGVRSTTSDVGASLLFLPLLLLLSRFKPAHPLRTKGLPRMA